MFEQWICAMDRQGNPGCGFVLVLGMNQMEVPQKCPCCGGRAWDILGSTESCRATKGKHVWNKGTDKRGAPLLVPDQVCEACGAVPVMEGVN